MTDSFNLAELQSPNLDIERQRFLQKWLAQSRPHMGTSCPSKTEGLAETYSTLLDSNTKLTTGAAAATTIAPTSPATTHQNSSNTKFSKKNNSSNNHVSNPYKPNSLFFLMSSNGHTNSASVGNGGTRSKPNGTIKNLNCGIGGVHGSGGTAHLLQLAHSIEGRKPKLRRFNSHDTSSNMFSVADFENARLARRNEIEMKQRLQRRVRPGSTGNPTSGAAPNDFVGVRGGAYHGCQTSGCGNLQGAGGDCSTGESKTSKHSNDSHHEPLPADVFFERYTMPTVVHISDSKTFCDETLQSSSSNASSTVTSHSSTSVTNDNPSGTSVPPCGDNTVLDMRTGTSSSTASSSGNNNGTGGSNKKCNTNSSNELENIRNLSSNNVRGKQGGLFLLYKFMQRRCIYYGHNTKAVLTNRKKAVLIPQEFSGYFSLVNEKGFPMATQYNSIIQLVRERVFKFVSVDNIPAFAESQPNQTQSSSEGCFPVYSAPAQMRPQYVRTTARAGEVYRLIAVFEDGKQDHCAISGGTNGNSATQIASSNSFSKFSSHSREKEKGRYAQLMNDGRQVYYVPLSTKGKFFEVEPGIPVILQRVGVNESNKKINPDCVYRITELVTPQRELPLSLRYISGPSNSTNGIPENLSITKVIKENILIVCPIEDVEMQHPLYLRKLYLTKQMNLMKSCLGFDSDKDMWSDPNVQNVLKFCQFNCDQFLQSIEIEPVQRPERARSKQRSDGLKLLKPLQLPKILRREKTTIPSHEKEDSIIFLTKTDLANLEAKESATATGRPESTTTSNRISEKMKVFQSTKKKWFRKQDKHLINSSSSLDFDAQIKRMSMERYTDMSKLLQERFGEKPNDQSKKFEERKDSVSEPSCSDTDTTILTTKKEENFEFLQSNDNDLIQLKDPACSYTLQKSISLQNIAMQKHKPNMLNPSDISEAGTDVAESEIFSPFSPVTSFITEKLYNEFHVKTRQHSKSSSSLNQLLNFSLPQKLNINDHKRTLAQLKQNFAKANEKPSEFNIGAPITGKRSTGNNIQKTPLKLTPTTSSLIEDELPYSSVRDSLVLSNDNLAGEQSLPAAVTSCELLSSGDYTRENIYAEICHEASAMGGIPNSLTQETITAKTLSTQISTSDDFGDYASLSYDLSSHPQQQQSTLGSAISRVRINCTSSPISCHTIYLGGEYEEKQEASDSRGSYNSRISHQSHDRAHVTTVELEGFSREDNIISSDNSKSVDNIYSTLK